MAGGDGGKKKSLEWHLVRKIKEETSLYTMKILADVVKKENLSCGVITLWKW